MIPRSPDRIRRLAGIAAVVWYAVILALTLPATVAEHMPGFPGADKIAHAAAYTVQGACLMPALPSRLAAVLVGSALGGLNEFLQRFAPGRSCEFGDFLADTAGVIAGVGAMSAVIQRRRRV